MSRLCLLLLLSLLLGEALGATFSYSLYSDDVCQTLISNGTVAARFSSEPDSINSGYVVDCFPISGVPGISHAKGGCVTSIGKVPYGGDLQAYSDSQCSIKVVALYTDTPPGSCGRATTGDSPFPAVNGSAKLICNGAVDIALVSAPLLAGLAALVSLLLS